MESAIVKVSDKVWMNLGGDVINNYCEMCGTVHDKPYYVVQDSEGDTWTVCSECQDRIEQGFPKYDEVDPDEVDPRD
jgi:ribosome-binding protein aMBF1 (putative translation factor)